MKKLLSMMSALIMALTMILGSSALVFAADTTYNITVPDTDKHTYAVYQIFTGELVEKEGSTALSQLKWGQNGTGTVGANVANDVISALESANGTDTAKLAVIEKYANLTGQVFGEVSATSALTVPAGYYLLKDKDAITGQDTYTKYIVKVVKDVAIERKADVPEMTKKVQEKNDSEETKVGNPTDWQDASDYDIGDIVPYRIQTTIVSNYEDYKTYYLAFEDEMEAGLTYQKDAKVYLGDTADSTKDITSLFTATNEEHKFVLEAKNLKTDDRITAGQKITVFYSAKLNEKAKFGSEGNKNTAFMKFSNNPNSKGEGTPETPETPGETPKDTVITFTYKSTVNKVDQNGEALRGAGFTLQKYNAEDGNYKDVGAEVKGEDLTTFEFKGLDAGKYKLVESTVPEGYAKAADIEFTIESEFGTEDADDNLVLKKLVVKDASGQEISTEDPTKSGNATFTVALTKNEEGEKTGYEGTVSTTVINEKNSNLPETGGMGTKMMYLAGGILVLVGGAYMITRRRMA